MVHLIDDEGDATLCGLPVILEEVGEVGFEEVAELNQCEVCEYASATE